MTERSPLEVVTPTCRLAFPSLFKTAPRFQNSERMTYQAVLLLPPDTSLTPFANAVKAAMDVQFGKQIRLSDSPIRSCDGKEYAGYEPGWRYINTHTGYAPGVVDQKKQPILDKELMEMDPALAIARAEERIFAGCWCRFHLTAFGWTYAKKQGVSFSLNGVQLVREDERLDGRAAPGAVFDEIEVEDDDAPEAASSSEVDALFG